MAAQHPGIRLGWSSRTTWIGALAVALALGVAALTSLASERAIRGLREDLGTRISIYGRLVANQLGPALSRDDGPAIRRTLDLLFDDVDAAAVSLTSAVGGEIYRHGVARPQPEDVTEPFETGDRIVAVLPVAVAGQPSSVLTIELSTDRLHGQRRRARRVAIVAGVAALLFAVLARRVMAREVVRRLRAIVEIETAAETDGEPPAQGEQPHDEIAIFGDAFHQMLSRLRRDQLRLRTTVSEVTAVRNELARSNGELERRVLLRTSELSDANRQLQAEMTQRSRIEVELRQAQKLESVGRLAAGIAHEINTPVQFVTDSCSFLETANDDLIALVKAYRTTLEDIGCGTLAPAAGAVRLHALEADRDAGYLMEQIPLAIRRALQGLERVAAIVRAMKDFAYPDHKEQAPADLNRAILSTLTVARNEYKYVAEVRTELADLPPVTCHIGELNQVILNMIVNSVHALESAKLESEREGLITVRTRELGDRVAIEVEDNGCGIPADVIDKIFDPFFTTKEIGKGTGQGLAIAHTVVVDKHAGTLEVASRVGHGTTFTIILPVHGVPVPRDRPSGQRFAEPDDSLRCSLGSPTGPDRESP